MGMLYQNSDGFLILCVQKVCVEPISISLESVLDKSRVTYGTLFTWARNYNAGRGQ